MPIDPQTPPPSDEKGGKLSSDGTLKIFLTLPPDLAKLFLKVSEEEDRNYSAMARHIIKKYFKEIADRKAFEEFKRLQRLQGDSEIHDYSDDERSSEKKSIG